MAGYYPPEEREIFHYFDGARRRRADPLVLQRRYAARSVGLAADMAYADNALAQPDKAEAANNKALAAIREIFDVPPFCEDDAPGAGGLTEQELIDLFNAFFEFMEGLKKNSSPTPTSPEATSDSTGCSSAGPSPTTSTSDSGSTGTGN